MYEKEQGSFTKGVETKVSRTRGGKTSHFVLYFNWFRLKIAALNNI